MRRTVHRLAFGLALGSLVACASSCSTESDTGDVDGAAGGEGSDALALADASTSDRNAVNLDASADGIIREPMRPWELQTSPMPGVFLERGGADVRWGRTDAVPDEKMLEGGAGIDALVDTRSDMMANEKGDARADASADRDASEPLPDDGGGPDRNDARDEHSAIDASRNDAAANDASTDDAGVALAPPSSSSPVGGAGNWPAAAQVADCTGSDG